MRQRAINRNPSVKRHFSLRRISSFVLAAGLLTVPKTVLAQFSGPSPVASYESNRPVNITTDPALLYPPEREIKLGPGDTILIHVYGPADYDPTAKLSIDGSVRLPLIGIVHLAGLTVHEAERTIASRLEEAQMYHDPQVSILVTEAPSQVATVIGEVHSLVPVIGKKRLFDVVSLAGGFTPTSSHVVTIQRGGVDQPIVVDMGNDPVHSDVANIPIFAGDTIIVARVGMIYVMGSVRIQGVFPLNPNTPLTAMQALAAAGGAFYESKLNDVKIIRTVGTKRTLINVPLDKTLKGKAPDPLMQADDVMIIPTNAMKAAIKAGGVGTAFGIATSFVYLTR